MYFPEKLRLLMELFKISNSQLARAVNVDASLISRWKSGQRRVSVSSPHLPALAHYFTRYHGYLYQQEVLDQLLLINSDNSSKTSEDQRIQLLTEWFVSGQMPAPLDDSKRISHLSRSEQLIAGISKILSAPPGSLASNKPDPEIAANKAFISQFNQTLKTITSERKQRHEALMQQKKQASCKSIDNPAKKPFADDMMNPTVAAQAAHVHKYKGHTGRRKAVLHFLYHLLRQPEPKKVFLYSEEPMDWLLNDRSFTFIWANLLMEIIKCGHLITIIHVVNRELNEMLQMLQYWMPLHLSGQIQSYYMPHYTEKKLKNTQFIIEDELALVSNIQTGSSPETHHFQTDQYLTMVCDDAEIIATHQLVFKAKLDESRQLFVLYQKSFAARLFEDARHYLQKSGAHYSIRDQLSIFMLPPAICKEIAPALYELSDQGSFLPMLNEYIRLNQQQQYNETTIQFYPVQLLDTIAREKRATLMNSELFMKKPIVLTSRQTIALLQSLIEQLEKNDQFHIMFVPDLPGLNDVKVNISYKKYASAFFSSNYRPGEIMIRLDETNILHALDYFIESLTDTIPVNLKRKRDVILRLNDLIHVVSGQKALSYSTVGTKTENQEPEHHH